MPAEASRKDSAVHVSLSSDAIVKQRGELKSSPGTSGAAHEALNQGDDDTPGKPCRAMTTEPKLGSVETRGPLISSAAVDDPDIGEGGGARQRPNSQKCKNARQSAGKPCTATAGVRNGKGDRQALLPPHEHLAHAAAQQARGSAYRDPAVYGQAFCASPVIARIAALMIAD